MRVLLLSLLKYTISLPTDSCACSPLFSQSLWPSSAFFQRDVCRYTAKIFLFTGRLWLFPWEAISVLQLHFFSPLSGVKRRNFPTDKYRWITQFFCIKFFKSKVDQKSFFFAHSDLCNDQELNFSIFKLLWSFTTKPINLMATRRNAKNVPKIANAGTFLAIPALNIQNTSLLKFNGFFLHGYI